MTKYKAGVLGHYGGDRAFLDGQTIKTKSITEQLRKELGADQVLTADTYGGFRVLAKCLGALLSMLVHCENIIILPAQNGVKLFPGFLAFWNFFFRRQIHYVVIGGWLPSMVSQNPFLRLVLKRIDFIYVETSTMKRALAENGLSNVVILPNFKDIPILTEDELVYPEGEPYRLCTFSRVMKEKGIEDAVEAVKAVNEKYGRTVYTLDIYGQVDAEQIKWFEELKESFPNYVRYKGLVVYDKSVEVLKDYFALLFPTRFYTEGIPGTIIDAYAAGVPVISAKWESFEDVVDDGVTGIGYEFGNCDELLHILLQIAEIPAVILGKKKNCIARAKEFSPDSVMQDIFRRI